MEIEVIKILIHIGVNINNYIYINHLTVNVHNTTYLLRTLCLHWYTVQSSRLHLRQISGSAIGFILFELAPQPLLLSEIGPPQR